MYCPIVCAGSKFEEGRGVWCWEIWVVSQPGGTGVAYLIFALSIRKGKPLLTAHAAQYLSSANI